MRLGALKVIYESGYNADQVAAKIQLLEGKNFLQKPYNTRAMAQAIRECLDNCYAQKSQLP